MMMIAVFISILGKNTLYIRVLNYIHGGEKLIFYQQIFACERCFIMTKNLKKLCDSEKEKATTKTNFIVKLCNHNKVDGTFSITFK